MTISCEEKDDTFHNIFYRTGFNKFTSCVKCINMFRSLLIHDKTASKLLLWISISWVLFAWVFSFCNQEFTIPLSFGQHSGCNPWDHKGSFTLCVFFSIATAIHLITTNGLYRTQLKRSHCVTVTTSLAPIHHIVRKNKSQLQIAQCERALTFRKGTTA